MKKKQNLNSMIHFEAVARLSRINLAASELSISPSAVSQQIRALETELGIPLFQRVKRRLILTEEGERLYASTGEALKMLREARLSAVRSREVLPLVVQVPLSLGVKWLGPRMMDFSTAHPAWSLQIDATSVAAGFERQDKETDLQIRHDTAQPKEYHSRPILDDVILPVWSPGLAAQFSGKSPSDVLRRAPLIRSTRSRYSWTQWLVRHGIDDTQTDRGPRVDQSLVVVEVAQAGRGIALESASLIVDELRSGSLRPLAPELGYVRFPAYFLVCPDYHLKRPAVRAFVNWLEPIARERQDDVTALLEKLDVASGAQLSPMDTSRAVAKRSPPPVTSPTCGRNNRRSD